MLFYPFYFYKIIPGSFQLIPLKLFYDASDMRLRQILKTAALPLHLLIVMQYHCPLSPEGEFNAFKTDAPL